MRNAAMRCVLPFCIFGNFNYLITAPNVVVGGTYLRLFPLSLWVGGVPGWCVLGSASENHYTVH